MIGGCDFLPNVKYLETFRSFELLKLFPIRIDFTYLGNRGPLLT